MSGFEVFPTRGFVLYRDHDGWFRWATAEWWDNPRHKLEGERIDTREEIGRFETKDEARTTRDLYNQMVHGKPTPNHTYNEALARKGATT